jgi:hypothetical protein
MYDKQMELTGIAGDVVRVEIQLRGKRLKNELADEDGQVTDLDFDRCYEVYRKILLDFKPAPLADVKGIDELLAIAQREGFKYRGVPLLDLWARGKNPRYVRAKKAAIARMVLRLSGIDWSQLLPEDCYPPVVELKTDLELPGDDAAGP